ncbi:MAG: cadherin-like beta sandwich domain-containing protein [Erysipelotrichaceae bacterium]
MVKKFLILLLNSILIFNTSCYINAQENVNGSTSASISSSSVVLGNQIKLTLTLKCDEGVGGGEIKVYYTSSYIKYDSIQTSSFSFSNNGNYIKLIVDPPSEQKSVSVDIYFSAIKIGSSKIDINISGFIGFDSTNEVSSYTHNFSFPFEIINKTTPTVPTTPTTPSVSLSSDATLYSLSINGLKLEEAFSSSKYEYTVYSNELIDKLDISAVCCSSKATYKIENNNLTEGWNQVSIICTAEDGSKKTYVIKVYVKEKPTLFYNEKLGVVKNLDKVETPTDFEKKEVIVENNNLTIYSHNNLNLIYLENENNCSDFYVIDIATNQIICKYEPINISGRNFLKIDFDYQDFIEMNDLFKENKYRINSNVTLNCWSYKAENMGNYRILYLMNDNGEKNLYCYEATEQIIQKFVLPQMDEGPNNAITIKDLTIYSILAASIFCLIISIALTVKRKTNE